MPCLIDTNILIYALAQSADASVLSRIDNAIADKACFCYGAALSFCEPPPRISHLRIGNMRLRDLFSFLQRIWPQVEELSASSKLVIVRPSLIECVS